VSSDVFDLKPTSELDGFLCGLRVSAVSFFTAEARRPQRGFAVGAFSERVTQKNPSLKKLS